MTVPAPLRRASPWLFAGFLAAAGAAHFAWPGPYERIVPPPLPRRATVYASGVAELGCAALVAWPRTRRAGGTASAALLVAVFPANLYAVWAFRDDPVALAAAVARLPLQIPLVLWAHSISCSVRGSGRGGVRWWSRPTS